MVRGEAGFTPFNRAVHHALGFPYPPPCYECVVGHVHLDEEGLLQFVQHALSPEALAQAEAHLRTCSVCRRAVALLAETEVQMDQLPLTPMPVPFPPAPRPSSPPVSMGSSAGIDDPTPGSGPSPSSGAGAGRPARRGKQIDRYVVL